jgi:membrane-bound lytic murein transglycosylase MltF
MLRLCQSPKSILALILSVAVITVGACNTATQQSSQSNTPVASQPNTPSTESAENIDPSVLNRLKNEHWTGDIDGMLERRYIRALVLYNKTNFFYDGPQPRGVTFEALKEFEKFLNGKLNTGNKPVHLIFIPVSPEEALKRMRDGRADIAASNIAIIPQLQEVVDFSDPVREHAKEVVVTGPSSPPITSLEDLSGKEVFVRKLSRYWPNIEHLNERFRSEGRAPVIIKEADQNLQDEDILDMVNAGLIGTTIMDDLVAGFWAKVYDGISVRNDLSLADEDKIGWAVQKGTPKFLSLINEFLKDHKVGKSFGNVMLQKYLRDTKWAKNSVAPGEMEKFKAAIAFFKKYAGQYKFEWLMIAAQAYQESTIDQTKISPVGAVGVMQIKPSTAADKSVDIHGVDKDIEKNINAGVKYLNFIMENYFKDAQMNRINRGLFAFASYNAGPNRIAKLRKQAEAEGLNPNVWFNNVELVAAKEIGAETVTYVSNIYKYYIAYRMMAENLRKPRSS